MAGTVAAGEKLTSAKLGVPPWTAMSPLLNSWTNVGSGFVTAQYRKWVLLNEVEVIGAIHGGANQSVFFTLPAGFIPASAQLFAGGSSATPGSYTATMLQCDTSGNLSVQGLVTSGNFVFHGWISLDA